MSVAVGSSIERDWSRPPAFYNLLLTVSKYFSRSSDMADLCCPHPWSHSGDDNDALGAPTLAPHNRESSVFPMVDSSSCAGDEHRQVCGLRWALASGRSDAACPMSQILGHAAPTMNILVLYRVARCM